MSQPRPSTFALPFRRSLETLIWVTVFSFVQWNDVQSGIVQIKVNHLFNGGKIVASDWIETEASEQIRITRCDYLLSDFMVELEDRVESLDGGEFPEAAFLSLFEGRHSKTLLDLPDNGLRKLNFKIGVSDEIDSFDPGLYPLKHALNPQVNGLYWGWSGGYIYFALEGYYRKADGSEGGFSFHIANAPNRVGISLPLYLDKLYGATVEVTLDLAKLLNEHKFERDGTSTHSREGDELALHMSSKLADCFSIDRVVRDLFQELPVVNQDLTTHSEDLYPLEIPHRFPQIPLPEDNLPTLAGVELGQQLFNDKRLSRNCSQSCAACHDSNRAFTEPKALSVGVEGKAGRRNAMPLTNLAWEKAFFWDGRASRLREQVLMPITDAHEMNASLPDVISRLSADHDITEKFNQTFGAGGITTERLSLALEQYLITELSVSSRFDEALRKEVEFTPEEKRGFELFVSEFDPARNLRGADCFHCHGGVLLTNHKFANNGLDSEFSDPGRSAVTGKKTDLGKFKVPSLRNVALTAPYMHDGRFLTLDEVIDHYDHGIHPSATLDPNIAKHPREGLGLSADDKKALIAFLNTLTDSRFHPTQICE